MVQAKKFIASSEARIEVQSNIDVARRLQFTGTPSFVVGNETAIGAIGYDGLTEMVSKARGSK